MAPGVIGGRCVTVTAVDDMEVCAPYNVCVPYGSAIPNPVNIHTPCILVQLDFMA